MSGVSTHGRPATKSPSRRSRVSPRSRPCRTWPAGRARTGSSPAAPPAGSSTSATRQLRCTAPIWLSVCRGGLPMRWCGKSTAFLRNCRSRAELLFRTRKKGCFVLKWVRTAEAVTGGVRPDDLAPPARLRMREFAWHLPRLLAGLGPLEARGPEDGPPVLVIPGFLAGDRTTMDLRRALCRFGWRAYPWLLGL